MIERDYRSQLRAAVAASAAPHGYTLTLWTAGAVTSHAQGGAPSSFNALMLLVGAATAFGVVGALAFGGINAVLVPSVTGDVRVWGGIHLPSVGLSLGVTTVLSEFVDHRVVWLAVGFVSTSTYLLVIGIQFWLASLRRHEPSETF